MEIQPNDKTIVIALNLIQGFGPRSFRKIADSPGMLRKVFEGEDDFLFSMGLTKPVITRLKETDPARLALEEQEKASRIGVRMVTYFDDQYPDILRQIHDPPLVLYQKGAHDLKHPVSVAVVGARRPTPYGLMTAEKIGRELAEHGFNVVSGMARGIDTAAHKGALSAGGRTTAVFGAGADVIYPRENASLAEEIMANGTIFSEFPLGTRPDRLTFPRRNRIISGLSLATIVVEAGHKSGSLITAEFALEQGREVFAVPGPISSERSAGCHRLIKEGAHLYDAVEELLEEVAPHLDASFRKSANRPDNRSSARFTFEEGTLLDLLEGEPLFIDELIDRSALPAEKVMSLMFALELKGRVRQFPGKRFALNPGEF